MKQPEVSIIVPVYQAEQYIKRLLDSISVQTFKDWECILVDDGSRDMGGSICDDYSRYDRRFRVIHKNNHGVSAARQTGLDNARGVYVIHADPDDWVASDWLQCLYEKIEESNADMVICDFERVYAERTVQYDQRPTSFENSEILDDFLNGKLWGACWNKLIRKKCFKQNNISFLPEMNLWEDLYIMCLLVYYGAKVEYVHKTLYHYDSVINENGIVMHRKNEHIKSILIFIEKLEPILSENKYNEGWYCVKSKLKNWIFEAENCNYNIKTTCSEINERYIAEAKGYPIWTQTGCIAYSLKWNPTISYSLYTMFNILRIVKGKIHNII